MRKIGRALSLRGVPPGWDDEAIYIFHQKSITLQKLGLLRFARNDRRGLHGVRKHNVTHYRGEREESKTKKHLLLNSSFATIESIP